MLLTACNWSSNRHFPKQIEPLPISIKRFDTALLRIDSGSVEQEIGRLYKEYGQFMPLYVEGVLGLPVADTALLSGAVRQFLSDTLYGFKETNALVLSTFKEVRQMEVQMGEAFARLAYLYPTLPIPDLYFFVSGFNRAILWDNELIAVGVDMYLGSDYPYYNQVVYEYQKQTMRPECIPADVLSVYLFANFPSQFQQRRLLEQMLYRGKIIYLLAALFPEEKGSEIMGYSSEQWMWCEKHEHQIWAAVLDQKDLFKNDVLLISKYLNEAPFTSTISPDSPGRLGTWLGWRIVESYMKNNSEVTLVELMDMWDAQRLLEASKYRP